MSQKTPAKKKTSVDAKKFLEYYNPDYIMKHCKGLTIEDISTLAIFSNTPTLSEMRATMGDNMPTSWLMAQLFSMSEFCGTKEKMDEDTAEKTAFIIYSTFYYLKASEILLFFHNFSSGKYGHFYGTTDPQILINAIHVFVQQERNPMIERRMMEERLKQREEERKHAISYDEWRKMST